MPKRSLVILLVGVNLLLLVSLVLSSWHLPEANAMTVSPAQNFLMVAAEIRDGVDALYVIDLSQRRMHAFIPNRDQSARKLFHVGFRDLQRDFRGSR